jgi:hypothetical protein
MKLDFTRLQKKPITFAGHVGYRLEEIYDMTDDSAVKAELTELAKELCDLADFYTDKGDE